MSRAKKGSESELVNTICEYLNFRPCYFWRANNIPPFSRDNAGNVIMRSLPKYTPKGLPDINIIVKGHYIGLEVKREKCYQTPAQKAVEVCIKANGGDYFVVRNLDEVVKIMS